MTENGRQNGTQTAAVTPKRRITTPPDDLDAEAKRFWRRTLAQLREQGTWEDSDVPLLESYVRNCEQARRARLLIPGSGTTRGSQGQLVEHPAINTASQAERDAHKYAEALLLTPGVRRKHGIEAPSEGSLDWLLRSTNYHDFEEVDDDG